MHRTLLALALPMLLAAGCDAGRESDVADVPDAAEAADAADAADDAMPAAGPVAAPPAAGPDAAVVPDRFRGRYAADAAACASAGHATRLEIAGDRVRFHESSGPVTAVRVAGDAVTITADLTGEGVTREATYTFELSADGQALADAAGGMERVRCD